MGTEKQSTKDSWDKLDIFVKLFSSLVLAAIALILQRSASDISLSLQKAQLLNNLISDLAAKSQTEAVKRNLSLRTLNYTFGEKEKALVLDIAKEVYQNTDNYDKKTNEYAFQIIKEKDPQSAANFEAEIKQRAGDKQDKLRSPSNSDEIGKQQPSPAEQKETKQLVQLVESTFSNIIYIQFRTEPLRSAAQKLQANLQQSQFNAPGIEKVSGNFSNEIRYFHDEDKALALSVKQSTDEFFANQTPARTFKLVSLTGKKFKAPKGQIEVWIQ